MGARVIGERANRNGRTVQLKPHRTIMGERTRHERGRVNTRIPALLIYAARLYLYPAISACRDTREREREPSFPSTKRGGEKKWGWRKILSLFVPFEFVCATLYDFTCSGSKFRGLLSAGFRGGREGVEGEERGGLKLRQRKFANGPGPAIKAITRGFLNPPSPSLSSHTGTDIK